MNKYTQFFYPVAALAFLIGIWHFSTEFFSISPVVLPSPVSVYNATLSQFSIVLPNLFVTALEALAGFIIAFVLGYVAAIGFVLSRSFRNTAYPLAIGLKSTPLIAIAPLVIIWAGDGFASKAILSALVCFFPILVASVQGLERIEEGQYSFFRVAGANKYEILLRLRVPSSLPSLFDGLRIATSLSVVGAVIGEFAGSNEGIGFLIQNSSYYLEMDLVFGSIIILALFSILFFYSISVLERFVVFWQFRG